MDPIFIVSLSVAGTVTALGVFVIKLLSGGDDQKLQRRLSVAEIECMAPLMVEALIAESVGPVAATGSFASLDGFAFLRTVLRKARWLATGTLRMTDRAICFRFGWTASDTESCAIFPAASFPSRTGRIVVYHSTSPIHSGRGSR